jgi:hypothetical protein
VRAGAVHSDSADYSFGFKGVEKRTFVRIGIVTAKGSEAFQADDEGSIPLFICCGPFKPNRCKLRAASCADFCAGPLWSASSPLSKFVEYGDEPAGGHGAAPLREFCAELRVNHEMRRCADFCAGIRARSVPPFPLFPRVRKCDVL